MNILSKYVVFLSFIITMSFSSGEYGNDYGFFGISASKVGGDLSPSSAYGLKYGEQNSLYRTQFEYNYNSHNNTTINSLFLKLDIGVLQKTFRKIPTKPYIGLVGGVMQVNDTKNGQDKGFLYGPEVGFVWTINAKFDLDLSYNYLITSKVTNYDINNISNINLSLHYFY